MANGVGVVDRKLKSMSNDDIFTTWEALIGGYDGDSFWNPEHGITMDEWANAVYMEKGRRGF